MPELLRHPLNGWAHSHRGQRRRPEAGEVPQDRRRAFAGLRVRAGSLARTSAALRRTFAPVFRSPSEVIAPPRPRSRAFALLRGVIASLSGPSRPAFGSFAPDRNPFAARSRSFAPAGE